MLSAGKHSENQQTLDLRAFPRTIWRSQENDTMNRRSMLSLAAAGLIGFCATGTGAAQEKQSVSFKTSAENAKYTQQLFIDVGDVPEHQVRVFEIHFTFPSNPPVIIDGVKLAEAWGRATSDYTDGNGSGAGYLVYVLENGDKFFARWTLAAQRSSESGKSNAMLVGAITEGTGKFSGIRGVVRQAVTFDPKAGFNEAQWDVEYRMEK
jgi:hypothetical protein